mmetsp:Transcript_32107/g.73429  ORF Transcript_32107/g.73429 Transcript_32107/m.73429 type:complete len:273 (+) Transcript_32107:2654-3472(+)
MMPFRCRLARAVTVLFAPPRFLLEGLSGAVAVAALPKSPLSFNSSWSASLPARLDGLFLCPLFVLGGREPSGEAKSHDWCWLFGCKGDDAEAIMPVLASPLPIARVDASVRTVPTAVDWDGSLVARAVEYSGRIRWLPSMVLALPGSLLPIAPSVKRTHTCSELMPIEAAGGSGIGLLSSKSVCMTRAGGAGGGGADAKWTFIRSLYDLSSCSNSSARAVKRCRKDFADPRAVLVTSQEVRIPGISLDGRQPRGTKPTQRLDPPGPNFSSCS